MQVDKIFEALASSQRRQILAYLSKTELTTADLAAKFKMTPPSMSRHLSILENAGLVRSEKRGQFVHYSLVPENLANTLNGFVQRLCPVSTPLRRESAALRNARGKKPTE